MPPSGPFWNGWITHRLLRWRRKPPRPGKPNLMKSSRPRPNPPRPGPQKNNYIENIHRPLARAGLFFGGSKLPQPQTNQAGHNQNRHDPPEPGDAVRSNRFRPEFLFYK